MQASIIYLLVLLSGTPNTGYATRVLYKYETLADCLKGRAEWLVAFPNMANLTDRLACVKHFDKGSEIGDYR